MLLHLRIPSALLSILEKRVENKFHYLHKYLYSNFEDTINPFIFTNMREAVELLSLGIQKQSHIFIIGDKDADGVSGISILKNYFESSGCKVSYTLPLENETYGSSSRMVEHIKSITDIFCIITVDTGIKEIELAKLLKSLKIPLIITDHHTPDTILPNTPYIINPHLNTHFTPISGTQVALKLIHALVLFQHSDMGNPLLIIHYNRILNNYSCLYLSKPFLSNNIEEKIQDSLEQIELLAYINKLKKLDKISLLCNTNAHNQLSSSITLKKIQYIENIELELQKIYRNIPAVRYKNKPVYGMLLLFQEWLHYKYNIKELLSFAIQTAGIASICDRMPMNHFENRALVKASYELLKKNHNHPLTYLIKKDITLKEFSTQLVPMQICPLLNAGGRLGKANLVVDFLSATPENQELKKKVLIELNKERQKKQKIGLDEVLIFIQSFIKENPHFIFYSSENIHKGVTGIIANRIVREYKKPTFILSIQKNTNQIVGSVRSLFPIYSILKEKEELFIAFGGHQNACGFSLSMNKLDDFQAYLDQVDWESIINNQNMPSTQTDVYPINLDKSLYNSLKLLEPYGEQNPIPLFRSEILIPQDIKIFGKKIAHHLKWSLQNEPNIEYILWKGLEKYTIKDLINKKVAITYNIEHNIEYNYYQCIIQEIEFI